MPDNGIGALFSEKLWIDGLFLLNEFVPVGGLFRDEAACLQVIVDAQACPGVDGGIALLGVGELRRFPVGELLSFADFLLEKDGVDLLQSHLNDLILLDQLLQFNKPGGMDVAHARELVEVIGGGQADFGATFVLKVVLQGLGDTGLVDAEEECIVIGGQLQQGDVVTLAAAETWARLGVKPDDVRGAQGSHGALDLGDGVDDMDLPREADEGHLVHGLFVD